MKARFTCRNRFIAVVAACLFVVGVSASAARVVIQYQEPGPFDPSAQGMCDFHNGIYFPTRALLAGTSPYGAEYARDYPVARQIPFFSPGILVLHAPLAILPLHLAEVLYFAISVLVVLAIAALCCHAAGRGGELEWILGLSAVMVFSRPGHITLFDGYFTLELVLASFVAIHWAKKRPVLAALALVVVSAKPTYILPLGFLLLARGNLRALLIGAVLSLLAAGLPLGWLAHAESKRMTGAPDLVVGFDKLRADIAEAQQVHMNMEDESPVESWTRLDLLAAVCKYTGYEPSQVVHLLVMAGMLALPMILLLRRRSVTQDDGLAGATGALICVATLSSLYHQSYDAMLLTAPLVGLAACRIPFWQLMSWPKRSLYAGLFLFPLFNYLATRSVLTRLPFAREQYLVVTSLSGLVIGFTLLLLLRDIWKFGDRESERCKAE
ncbi:MAG: glycosyltransferase family 87 protein [Planctomycetota bacterium]